MSKAKILGNVMIALGVVALLGTAGAIGARALAVRAARAAAATRADATKSVAGELILIEGAAPFFLEKTEVTVGAYRACVDAGACSPAAEGRHCNGAAQGRDDHPINCVDHRQAEAYCAWVGRRLPTFGEWNEAACGSGGKLPWDEPVTGAPPAEPRGCYRRAAVRKRRPIDPDVNAPAKGTCAVTDYPGASTAGLLGMAANVTEWTSTEEPSGSNRFVDAGGHWSVTEIGKRDYECGTPGVSRASTYRDEATGFRCARSVSSNLGQPIRVDLGRRASIAHPGR